MVITPLADADPKRIDKVIEARRYIGPTLVILPKWQAIQLSPGPDNPNVKKGWVLLGDFNPPKWAEKSATLGPLKVDPLVMKDSTAREIAGLAALPERARQAFAHISVRVERSRFAMRGLDAADWQSARAAYAEFALERLPA